MWFIGVEVEQEIVHPLLKKILDPPLKQQRCNKGFLIFSSRIYAHGLSRLAASPLACFGLLLKEKL